MIYYGVAAIFPLLMWLVNDTVGKTKKLKEKDKTRIKYGLVVAAILPMMLMFILRHMSVGADTVGYVYFFEEEIRDISLSKIFSASDIRFEVGFQIYVKIISLLTDSYTVFFLINGLLIFGILFHFAKKNTENPFVFFFLFITLGTYNFMETGLRQSLAMVICLLAVDFLKKNKPSSVLVFVLLVVLAYFFHKSAIIFLLMCPLSLIKKFDWMFAIDAVLALVLTFGFAFFQDMFNELLGYDYEIEETGNGGIFLALIIFIFAYSCLVMYNNRKKVDRQSLIVQLSLITIIFWLLRLISRTAERISYYYISGLYVYFAQASHYDKSKDTVWIKWLLILACFALFIYRNVGVTYHFFWQVV
ncbi:MAG: EpsG family protein [Clostridia bacterium]|nr:EpsG family protein [Clostridia bacterium]